MEDDAGDVLRCDEQLRTTLHYDDKEKLRRHLALLKREYIRTAQRLQRAERSEAGRSRIRNTQQNHRDRRGSERTSNHCLNPSSLTLDTNNGTASGIPQCQGHTGGPAESNKSRRSQVIPLLLPSDAACCLQNPDASHDTARGHRPSPALRLRSRRSRLRWEQRSTEAGRSTDNSEEGQEQSEMMDIARTEGSEEGVTTEVVNESEELFSSTESESSSLLLTHWNACGQTQTGDMEGKEIQQKQREKETELGAEWKKDSESTPFLLTGWNPAIHTEEQDGTQIGRRKETEGGEEGKNSRRQRDGRLCEDSHEKNLTYNVDHIKEEKNEMVGGEHDVKAVGLLDSCTLVEGLLFPAEYYVRTTRRMTLSQSQPDMQAVILSQLSTGRHRRGWGRGRGRGLKRHTHNHEGSHQHSQTDSSSLTTASVGPHMESQAADTSAELNSQSSSGISDKISACQINMDACFSPTVTAARPVRGRRRKRGRGRGRPQTPRCSVSLDTCQVGFAETSDDPQPTSSLVSSSPSLHGADGPKPCLSQGEVVPVPDNPQPASTHITATQPSSGVNGAQSSSTSAHLEVYPIFVKSSGRTNRSSQMSRSAASWRSLLLPSSPPAQTPLLPLPPLSSGPLVNNLMNFDILQDFHLPDDQFASLKLHKLRQVAVESGVEHFTSPSYNTRSSNRCSDTRFSGSSNEPVMPLPVPLSLTPTITHSPHPTRVKQAATMSVDFENLSIDCKLTDKLTSQSLPEESTDWENPGEQQTENLHLECQTHTTSTESVSLVQDCAADCVDQYKQKKTVILNSPSQSSASASNTHRSIERFAKPQPLVNFADTPAGVKDYVIGPSDRLTESNVMSSEKKTDCPGVVHAFEDQRSTNLQTEDQAIIKTLSFDCSLEKTPEEPSNNCTAVRTLNDIEAPGESPGQHLNVKSPAKDLEKSSEPSTSPLTENRHQDKCLPHHSVQSQLLLSHPLASAHSPCIRPHLRSSALPSSPALPSLGLTPYTVHAALPLTSSPSAPALTLPPPHSPSTQVLSPPALSLCPSLTSIPASQSPTSPAGQIQNSPEPATCMTVFSIQSQGSCGQVGLRTEETAEEQMMRCTHTLKDPAGGFLVDACCLHGSSGGLCVAAAGKWAVCLWSQTSVSDWSLVHTWAFSEPVINVFPVPDAAGLICVTLGQLEIREVRILSCSSLLQVLLREGLVQAVVGVSKSRVVTSCHSASGSTLQVFTLSDNGSTPSPQPLVSPGVCVGALATVDGLSDALIGTDEAGRLFIWNLKTGQLLRRILLGDGLSHTACLRGYSYCHQLLNSLEEEERKATAKDQMFLEEEKEEERTALFSLVAVNPLSGKSVQATLLYPPKAWSGRLCEADVNSSSVVGLSQSGCVCVWELGRQRAARMVWAPESDGWQLARWGAGHTLVTGHHNGDVTLHCYSTSQTSLCHIKDFSVAFIK
ncbi:partner and localizer of BRCA2 isoform X2 [Micropterus dolomieu]|uniref:partner and localizer of BRCA2 isoform X2 n=1 Tax=Micropterus dolomieu TaxID=147949 RepID=UPI001E8D0145|nr:partner and localizer of BRCA2 isoform X2 [Micropterus dolomieu]